jgi:serine protease Do
MRILRVAMRHTIESGDPGPHKEHVLCAPNVIYALAFALILGFAVGQARADALRSVGHQSGSASGAAVPKGIPPHAPGYLGILFQNLNGHGVEIIMVDHDGPAVKAGLQPHDVIVSFNGQPVTTAEALGRMIHDGGVGADVSMDIMRGGKELTVKTQLAYRGEVEREAMERMALPNGEPGGDPVVGGFVESYDIEPSDPPAARTPGFLAEMLHSTPFTGLVLEAMEPQLAGFFGVSGGGGLLVETVMPNSPASAAGLRAGDVVLRIDGVGVKSTSEWVRRLHASRGQTVTLIVIRDKRESTISLTPRLKKHSRVEWPELFGGQPTIA